MWGILAIPFIGNALHQFERRLGRNQAYYDLYETLAQDSKEYTSCVNYLNILDMNQDEFLKTIIDENRLIEM